MRSFSKGTCLAEFILFTKAHPLSRPRKSGGNHIYQPLSNQHEARAQILESWLHCGELDQNCIIEIDFYFSSRLSYVSKSDVDNLVKAQLDNLQACKVIKNDNHVVGIEAYKNRAKEDLIMIVIYEAKENES